MRHLLQRAWAHVGQWLRDPPPDQSSQIRSLDRTVNRLTDALAEQLLQRNPARAAYLERVAELAEARQMAGTGPWQASPQALRETDVILEAAAKAYGKPLAMRESIAGVPTALDQLLYGGEWVRDLSGSALEFSRWGIYQITLLCRLFYIKNPIIRRLIDVVAAYVFARGVDVSSPDPDAQAEIDDFMKRNARVFGQVALVDSERRKGYDGNLYWILFTDRTDTGKVNARRIDPTEIQEIYCDPEDSATPWFYLRSWTSQQIGPDGTRTPKPEKRWYPSICHPALFSEPGSPDQQPMLEGTAIAWDSPVHHRACGGLSTWTTGLPWIYPAIDWAREARSYSERCASVAAALAEIASVWTTKGGPDVVNQIQQDRQSQVSRNDAIFGTDKNPPAVAGSTLVTTPGMQVEAFKTQGAGLKFQDVKILWTWCCMVAGVPPTFIGDLETSNLATATSLDRPTETVMLERQEAWREDLVIILTYALRVSLGASNGRLREAMRAKGVENVTIRECARVRDSQGRWHYVEADAPKDTLEIRAEFPAIREGDIPQLMAALKTAVDIGMDKKEAVRKAGDFIGIPNNDEIVEEQFPEATYERDKTLTPEPPPPVPGQPAKGVAPPNLSAQIESRLDRLKEALNGKA